MSDLVPAESDSSGSAAPVTSDPVETPDTSVWVQRSEAPVVDVAMAESLTEDRADLLSEAALKSSDSTQSLSQSSSSSSSVSATFASLANWATGVQVTTQPSGNGAGHSSRTASVSSGEASLFSLFAAVATTSGTTTTSSTSATSSSTTTSTTSTGTTVSVPTWIVSLSNATLKADMTSAAATGVVSYAGLYKLFTDLEASVKAQGGSLTSSQFTDLKTIASNLSNGLTTSSYLQYATSALVNGSAMNAKWTGGAASSTTLGNLASGSSTTQLTELVDKWFSGTDNPSSKVTVSNKTYTVTYSAPTGASLYSSSGPTASDVNQGYIGDCYLLAGLAEVASQNQSAIKSMISDNGNGTYGVRFYLSGQAYYVTVDSTLANKVTFTNMGGSVLWASVVEKAYAEFQGLTNSTGNVYASYGNSFTSIGNGGYPEYTLLSITGCSKVVDYTASGGSWSSYAYNSSMSLTGYASGMTSSSLQTTLISALAAGNDVVLESRTSSFDSAGRYLLVSNHAMSITGYDSKTGMFIIRNPWGTESGQTWVTSFEVSLSTLLALGDTIVVDNNTSTASSSSSIGSMTATQIAALTTTQVAALTTTQLSSLTSTQAVGLMATQLNAMTVTALDSLTGTAVASLSTLTISGLTASALTSLTATQVTALTSTEIAAITATQAASLTATFACQLLTSQCAALTSTAVAALSSSALQGLTKTDIASLSTSQIASLTATEISALTAANDAGLSAADALVMSTTQVKGFSSSNIQGLTSSFLQSLSTADVAALTATAVASLTSSQFAALTSSQVAALTTSVVASLSVTDFLGMSVTQFKSLSSSQIAQIKSTAMAYLTTSDIASLTSSQAAALTSSQIGNLTSSEIKALTAPALAVLTTNQLSQLTVSIGSGQCELNYLNTTQLNSLSSTTKSWVITQESLAAKTTSSSTALLASR